MKRSDFHDIGHLQWFAELRSLSHTLNQRPSLQPPPSILTTLSPPNVAIIVNAAGNRILFVTYAHMLPHHYARKSASPLRWDIIALAASSSASGVNLAFTNPDGTSEAFCGNAIRSASLLFPPSPERPLLISTLSGRYESSRPGKARIPCSSLGIQHITDGVWLADVGTPHLLVQFEESPLTWSQARSLSELLNLNVTFFATATGYVQARTYERGAGETQSCGSAALCLAGLLHKTLNRGLLTLSTSAVEVQFSTGETLTVDIEKDDFLDLNGSCWIESAMDLDKSMHHHEFNLIHQLTCNYHERRYNRQ